MTDLWICTYKTHQRLAVRCLTTLTWHEVRAYAAKKLGADPAAVFARPAEAADGEPAAVVEVRHAGDDYSDSGGPHRLQERVGKKWVDS